MKKNTRDDTNGKSIADPSITDCPHSSSRRTIIKAAVGIGLGAPLLRTAFANTDDDPKSLSPQVGDLLVHLAGDNAGQPIKPEELELDGAQQTAYPMDPTTSVIRDGSTLNMLAVLRVKPSEMDKKTSENAAGDVVAYSAICTHQACPVSMWRENKRTMYCSCHGTEYDPRHAAKVVAGPAPKRLAMLPIELNDDGVLVVSGKFTRKVGRSK